MKKFVVEWEGSMEGTGIADPIGQLVIDSARALFDTLGFRETWTDVLEPYRAAADLIRGEEITRRVDRQGSLANLPHGHQNLLWTIVFVHRWSRTCEAGGCSE